MIVTITPELEKILVEQALHQNITPESLALELLRQQLIDVQVETERSAGEIKRQTALAAIRSGKYTRLQKGAELSVSETFSADKAEEKAREERRRTP